MTRETRPSRVRRIAGACIGLVATALLAGCMGMPESGSVHEIHTSGSASRVEAIDIHPAGPAPEALPADIVEGFLNAMQASPINPAVAREFLASGVGDTWQPTQTITYQSASVPPGTDPDVNVTLSGAAQLDSRGAWEGAPPSPRLSFHLVKEHGQWRITNPGDALIVPETWFEQRFRQYSLYFFDPTGRILVPEPVFVPQGRQLASSLIDGLVDGPPQDLSEYALDLLPAHLQAPSTVHVSPDGVADVRLNGAADQDPVPSGVQVQQLVAQLVWTLRQDNSIQSLKVSIGDQVVRLAGFGVEIPKDTEEGYAPYVEGSSTELFGLRDGKLVSATAKHAKSFQTVVGPFGQADFGLRDIVPDVTAQRPSSATGPQRAAGVTLDGSRLLVGSVQDDSESPAPVISGATDLLTPSWDYSGRLWDIDRGRDGAVVHYVDGTSDQILHVPKISGRDVKEFLVSRDASRLVAVVHRPGGHDSIWVARLLYNDDGEVLRALDATQVSDGSTAPGQLIRAIAWRSPTSILVLYPTGRSKFQVRSAAVDGAPSGDDATSTTLLGGFSALAGTPDPNGDSFAEVGGRLVDLTTAGLGEVAVDPGVTALTYAG